MATEFAREFAAFEARTIKRKVKKFWDVFATIELPREEAEEWCITPQYGLNLRTVFDAIDDDDWNDISDAIERLNQYV